MRERVTVFIEKSPFVPKTEKLIFAAGENRHGVTARVTPWPIDSEHRMQGDRLAPFVALLGNEQETQRFIEPAEGLSMRRQIHESILELDEAELSDLTRLFVEEAMSDATRGKKKIASLQALEYVPLQRVRQDVLRSRYLQKVGDIAFDDYPTSLALTLLEVGKIIVPYLDRKEDPDKITSAWKLATQQRGMTFNKFEEIIDLVGVGLRVPNANRVEKQIVTSEELQLAQREGEPDKKTRQELVRILVLRGEKQEDIAKVVNVSQKTVSRVVQALEAKNILPSKEQYDHWYKEKVRYLTEQGIISKNIARQLGLSERTKEIVRLFEDKSLPKLAVKQLCVSLM